MSSKARSIDTRSIAKRSTARTFVSLFLLLFAMSGWAMAQETNPIGFMKQNAGPPSEFAEMRLPDAAKSGDRSEVIVQPIHLVRAPGGSWSWQSDFDVDTFAGADVTLLSPRSETWDLLLEEPGTAPVDLRAAAVNKSSGISYLRGEMPSLAERGVPQEKFVLADTRPGSWRLGVRAPSDVNSGALPDGLLILRFPESPYRLYTHRTTQDLVVGREIGFVAYAYRALEDKKLDVFNPVQEAPHPEEVLSAATMWVTLPDLSEIEVPMFDDGLHADGEAGDGVFGATLVPEEAGIYRIRVAAEGITPDGHPLERTGLQSLPVVLPSVRIPEQNVFAKAAAGDLRMRVELGAHFDNPGDEVLVHAEVWGTDGRGGEVPVAWIGGLAYAEQRGAASFLPLGLDTRWIALAGAQRPFELRDVRIQDPDTFVPIARLDRLPMTLTGRSASVINKMQVPGITEDMRVGVGQFHKEPDGGVSGELVNSDLSRFSPGDTDLADKSVFIAPIVLTHGYCAGAHTWEFSPFTSFRPTLRYEDYEVSKTTYRFACDVENTMFWTGLPAWSMVSHSQGGLVSLYILSTWWTGLDFVIGTSAITVGSPYWGSELMTIKAWIELVWPFFSCNSIHDITPAGAAVRMASMTSYAKSRMEYWRTTSGTTLACHVATAPLLPGEDDGAVSVSAGVLSGAINRGVRNGLCHSSGMSKPPQTKQTSLNNDIGSRIGF